MLAIILDNKAGTIAITIVIKNKKGSDDQDKIQ